MTNFMFHKKYYHAMYNKAFFCLYVAIYLSLFYLFLSGIASVGVTDDPDPDGYVTYARHLQQNWALLEWRRLPGYPMLLALIDSWLPWDMHVDAFYGHGALLLVFAIITTLAIIWKFGPLPGAIYLAIIGINSFFLKASIIMLADLPHMVVFWLVVICATLIFCVNIFAVPLRLSMFAITVALAVVVHPSTHLRIHIFIIAGGLALLIRHYLAERPAWLVRDALWSWFARLALLSLVTVCVQMTVSRATQIAVPQPDMAFATMLKSSDNFSRWWLSYRMLLCLPAPEQAAAMDVEIEDIKRRLAVRNGYATNLTTPPGADPEFIAYFDRVPVPINAWVSRLLDHPAAFLKCALNEMKSKYHTLIRGITPFVPWGASKPWVTVSYPPDTGSPRDSLFWTTGINLLEQLPVTASASHVRAEAFVQVGAMVCVIALTVFGLVLLEKQIPFLGLIVGIGSLGWFMFLSIALPIETRYFMPQLPVIYLAQALSISWLATRVVRSSLSVLRSR